LAPYPNLVSDDSQWSLCDAAPVVLPELGADLGQPAVGLLRGRGIEVRLGPSLTDIRGDAVTLSDSSSTVPTRTVVWAAGASDSQLIGAVAQRHHLPLNKVRLVVDEYLAVPGHPGVWALGDAAAVLDLTHPGRITPPTAQHAQHQAKRAAGNVAASLQVGQARPYKHHNLGLVVDLAGRDAVAKAVGVPLTGLAAKASPAVTTCSRCPSGNNRVRVTVDWILDAVLSRSSAQLSYIPTTQVDLPAAERTDLYRHSSGTAATKCKTQQPANTGGRFSKTELRRGASGEEL